MKKQSGITLIALVITIMILLILAGVTISLVVGDNGILTQSTSAVLKNNQAKAVEDMTMAWASADGEYFSEWSNNPKTRKAKYFTEDNLELYLEGNGYIKDGTLNYNAEGISTLTYVQHEDKENYLYDFEIDSNGKVKVIAKTKEEKNEEEKLEKLDEGGLFDENNNQLYSWDDLRNKELITVSGTSLISVDENLTGHLIIPSGITKLPDYCYTFRGSKLTELTIPTTLNYFGPHAFERSTFDRVNYKGTVDNWCEIVFSSSMYSNPLIYADELYINGTLVEDVVLEYGTKINAYAFYQYKKLKSVTIPASVKTIGDNAFLHCTNLTNITVDDKNEKYCSIDGVLYTKDMKTLLYYPASKTGTTFNIKNTVTTIAKYAFYNNDKLFNVTIPNGVTNIEYCAFYDNDNLTNVTIPDSVTEIEHSAFYDCNKLTIKRFPTNLTSLGSSAFYNCDKLTTLTIGDGVTYLGDSVFYDCDGLTSVTIGSGVKTIAADSFCGCNNLTSITIPSSVTTLRDYAFAGCTNLSSITIPSSVISIGEKAFNNTAWLIARRAESPFVVVNGILIDGITATGSITIPDNVKTIVEYAFYGSKITELTIPGTVKTVEYCAFFRCDNLTTVTIEKGVESIGVAFHQSDNISKIYFKGTEAEWNAIEGSSYYTSRVEFVTE